MEMWQCIEQLIIVLLFLLACRQIKSVFSPQTVGGCSKGCGKKCIVNNLEKVIEQLETNTEKNLYNQKRGNKN